MAGELKETEKIRDELIGQRCGDSYVICHLLGTGGMGAVYMAQSARLGGRRAAVKVLRRELTNADSIARFVSEAFAAGSINDPAHVVEIIDAGELLGGRHYMLLEYCDGGSLEALLAKCGPLPFDQVISIVTPICLALASAHSIHIVHRDVKPGNVLFKRNRGVLHAKLSDFGLAKLLDHSAQLTAPLTILGSPAYMSPEQCDPRSNIDGRTDIFALGRVLYEMVTGRLPYPCELARDAIQMTAMCAPFPRPSALRPDLPTVWDATIMACLEHNRNRRITDANELLWRLNPSPMTIASSPTAMTGSPATIGHPMASGSTPAAPAAAMTIASSPAARVIASSPAAVTLAGVPGAGAVTLSGAPGGAWFEARSKLEAKRRARALVFVLGVAVGIALAGWIALAIAS